jgi:glycosidase
MSFADTALGQTRPTSLRAVVLPRRQAYHPSPADWRGETLYFVLVDRFSDGREAGRPLLDRGNLASARPAGPAGEPWRWDRWAESGAERWQGGTVAGVHSKLGYLKRLGVTALWLSPLFKQRAHLDSYHGYGVQDFLDVDPRFGTRGELVDLVRAAHAEGLRVILDVIFNHSGPNWLYPDGTPGGRWRAEYTRGRHPFGAWLGGAGQDVADPAGADDGVWPTELRDPDRYTRAGTGSLDHRREELDDPDAEHKRTDFESLRDFRLAAPGLLSDLAGCYKYWIALTDCDGFRIDTLKHVSPEEARNFCGTIKEFAANLGKDDFFLLGEIAGGDYAQDRYLDVLHRNLNAALDIGAMRLTLREVARGRLHPSAYFAGFDPGDAEMGSHRNLGGRHVSILDDHDHVFGEKLRFSSGAGAAHHAAAGVALQLLTLGVPCIYYGTEQGLGGPEPSERRWLPGWGSSDRYLREAMFGPEHPRRSGRDGLPSSAEPLDPDLPGFGPFGTAGRHCFDDQSPHFRRTAALAGLRQAYPVLRHGRQYLREIDLFGWGFAVHGPGQIVAWSRVLDDDEALCVLNPHEAESRGADVTVDADLSGAPGRLTVVLNTAEAARGTADGLSHPVGSTVPVERAGDGRAFVRLREIGPAETLVLANHP